MVRKISIVRTERGAKISVVAGDHVYQETYDSWDQAIHNVVALNSWTQQAAPVPAPAPNRVRELVGQNA